MALPAHDVGVNAFTPSLAIRAVRDHIWLIAVLSRIFIQIGAAPGIDVAKLYIYYHAPGDWPQVAETAATIAAVQREFYPDPGPCSTSVRVAGFAFEDLLIEIEAMAVTRE